MKSIALLLAGMMLLGLVSWSGYRLAVPVRVESVKRIPGMDMSEETRKAQNEKKDKPIETFFNKFSEIENVVAGSWPRFRGPLFDNIARIDFEVVEQIPAEGLKKLWDIPLGEGHAGAAVHNGRVYVIDYDEIQKADILRCFSLESGKELWQRGYPVHIKRNHGMSRGVPTVTDKYVVSIGPLGHAMCVSATDGELKWLLDMENNLGAKIPPWYTAQCPLIEDNTAILAPCGKNLMIGVDCESGEILWEAENANKWQMSHSSIIPMTFSGQKAYVYCAQGGMLAVSAGSDAGKVLWQSTLWNNRTTAPSPVDMEDGKIFLTAGYGAGSMIISVESAGGSFQVNKLGRFDKSVFACEQHTPIFYKGLLYTVLPKDGGEHRQELCCMDSSGNVLWHSGRDLRFGLGPYLALDDMMLVLADNGVLSLIGIGESEPQEIWSSKVLDGHDAWAPLALADSRLILRDSKTMICLDLNRNNYSSN